MDEWIKVRDALLVGSTEHMRSTNRTLTEAADALTTIIADLSRNASVSTNDFYTWLSWAKGQSAGICLFEGTYHYERARKLGLMLAFLDQPQYHMFLSANVPTPSIIDTRICPYFLRFSDGVRMQRTPELHFDAYFAGELLLLKETNNLFLRLIEERRGVFSAKPLDLLVELVTHRVFFEMCKRGGYLNAEHPNNGAIRSLMIKDAGHKLAAIARMATEDRKTEERLSNLTSAQLQSLRVNGDMAISVVRRMSRKINKHSPTLPQIKSRAETTLLRQRVR